MKINCCKKNFIQLTKSISLERSSIIRIIIPLLLLIKTILFLALIETSTANKLTWDNISFEFSIVQLAFILLILSFGYLLPNSKQFKFYLLFYTLYSLMLILDLWYFRVNRDFWGIKNIFFRGTFNPFNQSLIRPEIIDIVFVVDIFLLILFIKIKKITNNQKKNINKFLVSFCLSAACILISYILIDIIGIARWDKKLFNVGWSPLMTIRVPGPLGYHVFEALNTTTKVLKISDTKETGEVKQWLSQNEEKQPVNEYFGTLKGKNVVFLQLESFENFVINKKVNGKEVTPFINKLTKEGFYFSNIFEQNNGGNSIDCDFMVNTSILPLGNRITALYNGDLVFPVSLPRLLKSEGYTTITSHVEEAGEFNWTELHRNVFGVDMLWDIRQYKYEETVGYGLSDRSFLNQLSDKIKTLQSPFFLQVSTLSSHTPFEIQDEYRQLKLPDEIDKNYLGGYLESLHYTDRQVEMFFNKLNEQGILKDTVVVIYGDHAGVHKFFNKEIQELDFEGNWWKEYDHEIPLVIYSSGVTPKVFDTAGGQIDILPTVAYLLGINDSKYSGNIMGRALVNTNRNATIIKGDIIKGQVKNDKETEFLLKSYDIGNKIIKNRYFENINK